MGSGKQAGATHQQASCPYFRPAEDRWLYQVPGSCRGLAEGIMMIPGLDHYRNLCSTPDHRTCPIFRSQQGEVGLEAAWRQSQPIWLILPAPPETPPEPAGKPRPGTTGSKT
jgi:hypothetical protein